MTIEEKNEALVNAVNKTWDNAFYDWEMEQDKDNPNLYLLGDRTNENGYLFFLAGCRDTYGGWVWIEYEPNEDTVGIYIKDRPIQSKFKEDITHIFEKYSPFGMKVRYEGESTPVIFRKEKVLPEDFEKFFREFRNAYDEYYPLFYMVSVSAKKWYDGFYIAFADC